MEAELRVGKRVGRDVSKQEECINEQCIAVIRSGIESKVSFLYIYNLLCRVTNEQTLC